MKRFLNMTIATPEGVIFEGEVESAEFPGTLGAFTLLPLHAALISSLTGGQIVYVKDGKPDGTIFTFRLKAEEVTLDEQTTDSCSGR